MTPAEQRTDKTDRAAHAETLAAEVRLITRGAVKGPLNELVALASTDHSRPLANAVLDEVVRAGLEATSPTGAGRALVDLMDRLTALAGPYAGPVALSPDADAIVAWVRKHAPEGFRRRDIRHLLGAATYRRSAMAELERAGVIRRTGDIRDGWMVWTLVAGS